MSLEFEEYGFIHCEWCAEEAHCDDDVWVDQGAYGIQDWVCKECAANYLREEADKLDGKEPRRKLSRVEIKEVV